MSNSKVFTVLVLSGLIFLSTKASARSVNSYLPAQDKMLHFSYASLATSWHLKLLKEDNKKPTKADYAVSVGNVFILSFLKEVHDEKEGGRFDNKDMVANILGIVTGSLIFIEC